MSIKVNEYGVPIDVFGDEDTISDELNQIIELSESILDEYGDPGEARYTENGFFYDYEGSFRLEFSASVIENQDIIAYHIVLWSCYDKCIENIKICTDFLDSLYHFRLLFSQGFELAALMGDLKDV